MSWKAEYIVLIMISTLVDYLVARKIPSAPRKVKKILLGTSLTANLGLLFAFKYFNFFSESIQEALHSISIPFHPLTLQVLLPVGISFYTFQTLSYTIDVYRGKIKPEKHLGIFAAYVSFFPQLVAGPIERAKNLIPQFYIKHKFEYKRVTNGLKLMLWGFFKKIVIADRLAILVNEVYNNPFDHHGFTLILATIFFAYQIYCDFSGYSDIAIGAAQVMGFSLMDNFKRPYFSQSISEFWRRWHISLSTWFRDYLYIPLGGNRVSIPRWYFNLFFVFLVSGFWHGANWTFILWGGIHGFYLVFSIWTQKYRDKFNKISKLQNFPKIHKLIRLAGTFILVNIAWIFFRANNISEGWYILTHLFSKLPQGIHSFLSQPFKVGLNSSGLLIGLGSILFMETIHIIQEQRSMRAFMSNKPTIIRWSTYILLLLLILVFGVFDKTEFIYFQF